MTIKFSEGTCTTYRDGDRAITVALITEAKCLLIRHQDGAAVEACDEDFYELLRLMDREYLTATSGLARGATPNPVASSAACYRIIDAVFVEPCISAPAQP